MTGQEHPGGAEPGGPQAAKNALAAAVGQHLAGEYMLSNPGRRQEDPLGLQFRPHASRRRASSARNWPRAWLTTFTLAQNANGTDTLTLSQSQLFDPSALQQALARDGIPALVKIGTYCSSYPAPPRPSSIGVISVRQPDGTPAAKSSPGDQNPVLAGAVTVINPAKMPAGTELFFDYIHHGLVGSLIYTNSYTCTSGFPHGGPPAS
jgi:hypothetical protein